MAGLYIHIPFCAKRCTYCDFFSNTCLDYKEDYINALLREMEVRQAFWKNETFNTIYFGGGTPSQIPPDDLKKIFDGIYRCFSVSSQPEVTFEANPDDLSDSYIASLTALPVNRLSIGVQSFDDSELRLLNRRHTAQEAYDAVIRCKMAGLTNINIDLMFGLPEQTTAVWSCTIDKAIDLDVSHLSAYNLTYEEGTSIYKMLNNKEINPIDDDVCAQQYNMLADKLTDSGFIHYEISNFARRSALYPNGRISIHNASYWDGTYYLGLGPSAHSYNGTSRSWNNADLSEYIKNAIYESEPLDDRTKYNDYIVTHICERCGAYR